MSIKSKLKQVVDVPHGNIYTFRIDANLWLNTKLWLPLLPLGTEIQLLFHRVDFIKNLGIDIIIF